MHCRNCGHENPAENRFCGMCGHLLLHSPEEKEFAGEREDLPWTSVWQRTAAVETEAEEDRPSLRTETPAPTTLSGPSFLGLSAEPPSTEPSSDFPSSRYSYLFQDEPEPSHKGTYIFLLLLAIAGAAVYMKWQPIRDYVITTARTHMGIIKPAATEPPAPTTSAAPDVPAPPDQARANTVQPEADLGRPSTAAMPQQDKPESPDKTAAPPNQPAPAPDAKSETKSSTEPPHANPPPAEDHTAKPEAEPADAESAPSAPTPRARGKRPPAPADHPGGELVDRGEKYLYGRGVPRSCDTAVRNFRAAAAQENSRAFSHLGALYATGECVPQDRALAYAWLRRAYAKEPGNRYFERNLTMLWRDMTPDERQRAVGR